MSFRKLIPRLVLSLGIAAVIVWALFNRSAFDPNTLDTWLKSFGLFGPLVYVIVFALGTIAFVPGSLFALAGGVLFGPIWGSVLNLLGATLGASLAFLIARYLASGWIARKSKGRLIRIVSGVEAEGWRFIALVRLAPIFPFNLTNYALGLTRIRFLPYAITSFICMAPGAIAFTWLGYAGREAAAGNSSAIRYGLMALALLAAIAFLPRLFKRLKPIETGWISVDELNTQIRNVKAFTIIDVRGRDEFDGPLGHIRGALNIPLIELDHWTQSFKSHIQSPIILVCKTDRRSATAEAMLRGQGFQHLHVLRGGMVEWSQRKFQVQEGQI